MSRYVSKDEYGGFDKSVLLPGDSRCILRVQRGGGGGPAHKSSPFTNAPIQTGGFGGTLNNSGYGGAAPRRTVDAAWQVGADRKRPGRR